MGELSPLTGGSWLVFGIVLHQLFGKLEVAVLQWFLLELVKALLDRIFGLMDSVARIWWAFLKGYLLVNLSVLFDWVFSLFSSYNGWFEGEVCLPFSGIWWPITISLRRYLEAFWISSIDSLDLIIGNICIASNIRFIHMANIELNISKISSLSLNSHIKYTKSVGFLTIRSTLNFISNICSCISCRKFINLGCSASSTLQMAQDQQEVF